ncbi:hypothetical protein RHMOL_Rhmol02G0281000 [Rhododendron molle]|uniref:Uncharacterized protein n=1 Tax=Rhododendron molle TaxID=49168 RepID=A0ACC0PXE8_RHOML|nr:hypothetical protein RHMOL_Rhmol02G0281000 [Rhododendron molle]
MKSVAVLLCNAFAVTISRDRLEGATINEILFRLSKKDLGFVQVKQKQLSSGVILGDDVLTMVVEPQIDHSLVMALVTVYGLMRERFE